MNYTLKERQKDTMEGGLDKNGHRHGTWEQKTIRGNLVCKIDYFHGIMNGEFTAYSVDSENEDELWWAGNYVDGILEGEYHFINNAGFI